MIKFEQSMPTYCEGFDPELIDASSMQELLASPLFKRYSDDPKFEHFALEENTILAISDSGFSWWVVGYVKTDEPLDLPKWCGWKFKAILDGEEVVLGDEVISSCGDRLTLRDGRVATNLR